MGPPVKLCIYPFRSPVPSKPIGECWLWPRGKSNTGYGNYANKFRKVCNAHKSCYELFRGVVPAGLQLDHLCRVRHCVNPWHMEIVTNRENAQRGIRSSATKCLHGHMYDEKNTRYRISKFGTIFRDCRACQRYRDRRRRNQTHAIHT